MAADKGPALFSAVPFLRNRRLAPGPGMPDIQRCMVWPAAGAVYPPQCIAPGMVGLLFAVWCHIPFFPCA